MSFLDEVDMDVDSPNLATCADSALLHLQKATAHLRVAIVHDWLVVNGGAEKVTDKLLSAFPAADIFTTVDNLPDQQRSWLAGRKITTSFLQKIPFAKKRHRLFLPLMPFAMEQLDVSDYDLVISSSSAVAKGVMTHPGQVHICYCHTPMRYAWDMKEQYLKDAGYRPAPLEWLARYALYKIRHWDYSTAGQVDYFWANSKNVARRINKYYRRESEVLYPPVSTETIPFSTASRESFYLAASRLVPYKRIDLAVKAFQQMPERKLVVIGDGPEAAYLEQLAARHENITLLGYCEDGLLYDYLARARGFIFSADDDFGIMPLEAQACGTPVIAYGKGGALETVRGAAELSDAERTGIFFGQQTVESLCQAIIDFECIDFSHDACRKNAECFSSETFLNRIILLLKDTGLLQSV